MEISVTNAGPEDGHAPRAAAPVVPQHVVVGRRRAAPARCGPSGPTASPCTIPSSASCVWQVDAAPDGARPDLLFCENETNAARLLRLGRLAPVPEGRHQRPRRRRCGDGEPRSHGTEVRGVVPAHGRARRDPGRRGVDCARRRRTAAFGTGSTTCSQPRRAEADEFYAEVIPATVSDDERLVARQAFAGMIWGKQFYCYDVRRWLDGDPTQPPPPPERRNGRNAGWVHMDARDILSMPDPWEYPWFAAWDLALPHGRARPPRPGVRQVPAARAVPRVVPAPERRAPRLRVGVRRRQPAGARVGGAARVGHRRPPRPRLPRPAAAEAAGQLHLVGQPDRPRGRQPVRGRLPRPRQHQRRSTARTCRPGGRLEQADGTDWMAFYALTLLEMARILADDGRRRGPTSR